MFQPQLDGAVAHASRLPDELSLYRAIFEKSSDAISVVDVRGNYVHQNAAHEALGVDSNEAWLTALRDADQFHGEITSTSREGDDRLLEVTAFAVRGSQGEPLYYVAVKRDVTQRRRNEDE